FNDPRVRRVAWTDVGKTVEESGPLGSHLERIWSIIDVNAIIPRHYKVLLDANGGAGVDCGWELFVCLGCHIVALAFEADGSFLHPPEPTPVNLVDVAAELLKYPGAFAACLDPDADRLALIDENGRCLSEELTLALAVQFRLSQECGPVAISLSTLRVIE